MSNAKTNQEKTNARIEKTRKTWEMRKIRWAEYKLAQAIAHNTGTELE